jgi:hypothetical protein
MHVLTNSLIRVRDEIRALRHAREEYLTGLERETRERRATVSQMLTRFSGDFTESARKTKAHRMAFLSNLKRTVSNFQRGVRADIGGVQQAFGELRSTLPGAARVAEIGRGQGAEVRAHRQDGRRSAAVAAVEGQETEPAAGKRETEHKKRRATARKRHRR